MYAYAFRSHAAGAYPNCWGAEEQIVQQCKWWNNKAGGSWASGGEYYEVGFQYYCGGGVCKVDGEGSEGVAKGYEERGGLVEERGVALGGGKEGKLLVWGGKEDVDRV